MPVARGYLGRRFRQVRAQRDARRAWRRRVRLKRSEAERVEQRDRARAHREYVAQDATDSCRGALIRLDGGGMVVRLDLERDRDAVADRDDSRILARALKHVWRLRR